MKCFLIVNILIVLIYLFAELLVMGGDKISPSKLEKINETLKKNNCKQKITYGYGSTETMMIATTVDNQNSHMEGSCEYYILQ